MEYVGECKDLHDESTSNLVHHSDRCAPGATTTTSSIASFAYGSTYSYPKFCVKLALWVACCHRPFSIVEDEELIDIFMDLNNKVEVPSHVTVSRDVKEIFQISQSKVVEILQVGHLLGYVLRLLTSLTNRLIQGSFIYVLMVGRHLRSFHSLEQRSIGLWTMQSIILDFIKCAIVPAHHTQSTYSMLTELQKHIPVLIWPAGCQSASMSTGSMEKYVHLLVHQCTDLTIVDRYLA